MAIVFSDKIVIDTNVLFEGLTKQGGATGLIVDAWALDALNVNISTALVYEYEDVLSRKLSDVRWHKLKPLLLLLVKKSSFTPIYFSWRPTSPDPGDDLVIDCAMNAGAIVVTSNLKDFKKAQTELGLTVKSPEHLIAEILAKRNPT